jgi:hypothetical protein
LHGGESGIGLTEGGWKFPDSRGEFGKLPATRGASNSGLTEPASIRTVRYTDIPKISVLLLNQYRYIDTGYSTILIYRNYRYTEISDIPEFFGISC